MSEYLLVILITYSNKCGVQYKTESIASFKTEQACRQHAEQLGAMYMRAGKTNVKAYEYSCIGLMK